MAGTEASDQRECSLEVFFFFLFVLFDKSIISSLSYRDPGSSTILFLPLTAHPLPTPGTLKAPPSSLPHTPMLCHCSPDKRPSGSSYMGPRALIKVGCRHVVRHLFLSLFCFQPTLEQREKPGSTHKQIQSKETERQRFRGRSPERRRQGGRMPQMARPLNGWNQVFSHSLTLG